MSGFSFRNGILHGERRSYQNSLSICVLLGDDRLNKRQKRISHTEMNTVSSSMSFQLFTNNLLHARSITHTVRSSVVKVSLHSFLVSLRTTLGTNKTSRRPKRKVQMVVWIVFYVVPYKNTLTFKYK